VLASVAAVAVLATAGLASAQEVQVTGPLKGAPAVRHLRLYRQGRVEISPTVGFTLLDEYRRTILAGAMLNYSITDWLSIGVWGGFGGKALSSTTDLTDRMSAPSGAPHNQFTANQVIHSNPTMIGFGDRAGTHPSFADQTAYIDYVLAPQLTFIPFRGKLAIFNKIFVDSDLYLAAGAAFVGIHERENCGGGGSQQPQCNDPASFQLASSMKVAPTFGVGFKFYPGNFWSLGVEYRAFPFSWNRAGFDSRGAGPNGNFPDGKVDSQDDTFKFNMMINISLGFYLPTMPKISD
jgi:hypothetical protein